MKKEIRKKKTRKRPGERLRGGEKRFVLIDELAQRGQPKLDFHGERKGWRPGVTAGLLLAGQCEGSSSRLGLQRKGGIADRGKDPVSNKDCKRVRGDTQKEDPTLQRGA